MELLLRGSEAGNIKGLSPFFDQLNKMATKANDNGGEIECKKQNSTIYRKMLPLAPHLPVNVAGITKHLGVWDRTSTTSSSIV
jgi:hypothetical protein